MIRTIVGEKKASLGIGVSNRNRDRAARLARDIRHEFQLRGLGLNEFREATKLGRFRARHRWLTGLGLTVSDVARASTAVGMKPSAMFELSYSTGEEHAA